MSATTPNPRRALPGVDALLRAPEMADLAAALPHADLVAAARLALKEARSATSDGAPVPDHAALVRRVAAIAQARRDPLPLPVINATGVIVNTNLGRAPLSEAALDAMRAVAGGYAALEYDLAAGERGSRHDIAAGPLIDLTGAAAAVVVNNAAAALLIILATLVTPDRREVVISRGQLIEIGGGFRIPDVLRQSGATLVEVGTTNRTRLEDYAAAIGPATALVLAVHPSNFRVVGFTASPALADLAALAHARDLPLVEDLGSGCLLDLTPFGLAPEPTPRASISSGADLVCFSGDKLLGGPQAGIIVGRADLVGRVTRHPLMRALRVDKVTLAGLVATLRHYQRGEATTHVPVWRMIALPAEAIRQRAIGIVARLGEHGVAAEACQGASTVGGGARPGETLPTWRVALPAWAPGDLDALARRLRLGRPPIVARVSRDHLLLDPRTMPPERDTDLIAALIAATPGKKRSS